LIAGSAFLPAEHPADLPVIVETELRGVKRLFDLARSLRRNIMEQMLKKEDFSQDRKMMLNKMPRYVE